MLENDEHVIVNHLYLQEGDTEIGFFLHSNKHFVTIETKNKEGEKFSMKIRLINFLTIADTLKSAAGWGERRFT